MDWKLAPYDAASVMLRSGGDSTESPMAMFCARSLPPLRVLDNCATAIPAKRTYCTPSDSHEEVGDDDTLLAVEDSPHHVEKKKRLTTAQVRSLEVSFESDNRLLPERKQQLADQLGLQPRQVAVWFQNRRARWKTRRLEHDYNLLKADYDAVVVERDCLTAEVARLTAELQAGGRKGEGNDVEDSQEQSLMQGIGGSKEEKLPHEPDSRGVSVQGLERLSPKPELVAFNSNDSPVSSVCSDILDEGSPNQINTIKELRRPPYSQLAKLDHENSSCVTQVGYPHMCQQFAVKVEEDLLLEESNLNLFPVDEHELQWLWLN